MSERSNDTAAVVEVLEDIRKWVKIIGLQEAMPVLEGILTDEDNQERQEALRIIYHLTDGTNSNADIAKHISYSEEFVRLRQNEWADMGLLEREKQNKPYTHVISLQEAGIEVPNISEEGEGAIATD